MTFLKRKTMKTYVTWKRTLHEKNNENVRYMRKTMKTDVTWEKQWKRTLHEKNNEHVCYIRKTMKTYATWEKQWKRTLHEINNEQWEGFVFQSAMMFTKFSNILCNMIYSNSAQWLSPLASCIYSRDMTLSLWGGPRLIYT